MDQELPDIDQKLERLREIEKELYGARLIERTKLSQRQRVKQLYQELSKHIHSGYEGLRPLIQQGKGIDARVTFAFDEELFNKCFELTNSVMGVAYLVVFHGYPELMEGASQRPRLPTRPALWPPATALGAFRSCAGA